MEMARIQIKMDFCSVLSSSLEVLIDGNSFTLLIKEECLSRLRLFPGTTQTPSFVSESSDSIDSTDVWSEEFSVNGGSGKGEESIDNIEDFSNDFEGVKDNEVCEIRGNSVAEVGLRIDLGDGVDIPYVVQELCSVFSAGSVDADGILAVAANKSLSDTVPGSKKYVEVIFDSVVRSIGEAAGRDCLSHGSNNSCSRGKTISEVGRSLVLRKNFLKKDGGGINSDRMDGETKVSDSNQGKEEDVCYEIYSENSLIGVNNVKQLEKFNKDAGERL